jgi:hypothetical protein
MTPLQLPGPGGEQCCERGDPQAGLTLWEVLLSAELAKIDAYLDDERPASARLAVVVWNGRRKAS